MILRSLKKLFPKGKTFRNIKGCLEALIGGIADAVRDLRDFYNNLKSESLPNTAVDTIDEWTETLGVYKPGNITTEEKQNKATARYKALVGGQDPVYLQDIVDRSYSDITLIEKFPPDGTYSVVGTVSNNTDFIRMKGLIETIMPGHLEPIYVIDILSESDEGIVGTGVVGLARVGKT